MYCTVPSTHFHKIVIGYNTSLVKLGQQFLSYWEQGNTDKWTCVHAHTQGDHVILISSSKQAKNDQTNQTENMWAYTL